VPVSEAASPAGISSFFEICNVDSAGILIKDPARIGARGGGFGIKRGLTSRVTVRKASHPRINIRINSKPAPEARTTKWAINEVIRVRGRDFEVTVDLRVRVPMRAGFGTSAAGTLATCLALADAIELPTSLNELGRITHIAEVLNGTGLGTASALLQGGFVLVKEPGAPGVGLVDRLLFPRDHVVICAYLGPIPTRDVLSQSNLATRVNPSARRVMKAVRKKPDLRTFLQEARKFSDLVGFQTTNVSRLMATMISAGAIGVAQNMLGEAVHGVIAEEKAAQARKKLQRTHPSAQIFVSRLDNQGVRLVEPSNPKH
jgi:pantoate kinase